MSAMTASPGSIVIVGCASGIGAAGARRLAADGWRLALVDIARERLEEVGKEVGAATTIVADAADPAALSAAIEQAVASLGTLTAAWSNVGVQTNGNVEKATVQELDRCYAVNLRAHFLVAKHTVPTLRKAGGGSVVITASNAGLQSESEMVAYCATKAAAIALTRLLARDHARDGIRVNALAPGFVDTPFNAPVWSNFGGRESFLEQIPEVIPLGRMASAEEIGEQVRFLLSPAASYITGHVLVADGGELVS